MPVSINERSTPAPAQIPLPPGNGAEAASHQAAELDVWEDEGGTTSGRPPEVVRRHAPRHFDELSD